jgi:hypothetical protein
MLDLQQFGVGVSYNEQNFLQSFGYPAIHAKTTLRNLKFHIWLVIRATPPFGYGPPPS